MPRSHHENLYGLPADTAHAVRMLVQHITSDARIVQVPTAVRAPRPGSPSEARAASTQLTAKVGRRQQMYFTHRTSADGCVAMLTANAPRDGAMGAGG
jgi:hypothetical protein